MAFTQFKTVSGSPKTDNDASTKDIRSRQIEELIKQSEDARKEVYGVNHDETCQNFYNLFESVRKMPSYRPRIMAPQLQVLLLREASDSTDTNMRVYIHKKDERDKDRERAFQEHWKKNFFNLHILMSQVYAQFSGMSWLQVGNDIFARQGKGNVWLRARKQGSVYVDPCSPWPEDWSWMVIEDNVYLDQVKKEHFHAADIKKDKRTSVDLAGGPAGSLEMPPGPMSVAANPLPFGNSDKDNIGLLKRRTLYCLDASTRELNDREKAKLTELNLPIPDRVYQYPEGRMVVDVEGTIVADGPSWVPLPDIWPAYPVWALPPWDTVWPPAPFKFTKSLQDAAEQQMTNCFENAKRLNNGIMVIHESTGLTANAVGGLPGEILVVGANSQPGSGVDIKYPTPFASQQMEYPMKLLALQKELRGATDARSGNLNPGNVGPDLFEAAVSQASAGTRLTARLFSWSIQKATELLFYTMAKSYKDERVFRDGDKKATWEVIDDTEDYEVNVPEGAVRPLSESALRSMVIELKKAGMIDIKHGLDMLDVPDADEIADALKNELELAAIAKGVKK